MGLIIKKEPFPLLSKQKREGGRHISGQFMLKAKKKWNKSEKNMVLTVRLLPLSVASKFFQERFR